MELNLEQKAMIGCALDSMVQNYREYLQNVIKEGRNNSDDQEYVYLVVELSRYVPLEKYFNDALDLEMADEVCDLTKRDEVNFKYVYTDVSYFDDKRLICHTVDEKRQFYFNLPDGIEEYDFPFVLYGEERTNGIDGSVYMIVTPEQYKGILDQVEENNK